MRVIALLCFVVALGACEANDPVGPDTDTSDAGTSSEIDGNVQLAEPTLTFTPVTSSSDVYSNVFTHEGHLFATHGRDLERSDDFARTWQRVGPAPAANWLASDGARIYAFNGAELFVSSDDGVSFVMKDDPFGLEVGPDATLNTAVVTPDAWWIAALNPLRVARSLDHGDSFEVVPLPDGALDQPRLFAHGDDLYLVASQKLYRTSLTGAVAWQPLDPGSLVNSVWVSDAGSVFVATYLDFATRFLRLAPGADTWADLGSANEAWTFLQDGADVVRVGNGYKVDVSHDDGATWETWAGAYPNPVTSYGLVVGPEGLLMACELGWLRLARASSSWVLQDAGVLPPYAAGGYRDLAFSRAARIALLAKSQVFVSDDDGATWRRTDTFADTDPLSGIAIKPDGAFIFVGTTFGRYFLVDTRDMSIVGGSARNIGLDDNTVRQATWVGDETQAILLVTTANDDDTDGMVLRHTGTDDGTSSWFEINPSRVASSPTTRFTQGYHAIAMEGARLHVLFRRWTGTNAWQPYWRENYDYFDDESWLDREPAVPFFAARSVTLTHGPLPTPIVVYDNDTLWLGSEKVIAEGVLQPPLSAKLDPQSRLWIVAGGIYRSAPLTP